MLVTFLSAALRDLENIGDYIAQDDPVRAITFIEELRQATDVLAVFPDAFPVVDGYEDLRVRFHTHGRYVIYYRVFPDEGRVAVLRVLHGAQDRRGKLTL